MARALPAIQGLRAAAALSVTVLHVGQAAGALVGTPGEVPFARMAGVPWEAGVDVFFVISGFVMAYASAALFGARGAAGWFLRRRVARVVPLYWLVTTATIAIALVLPGALNDPLGDGPLYVLASYLFIPWMRPDGFVQPVFRLGWTLNFEAFFYAVFAAVLLSRLRAAAAVPLIAGVIAALVAAGILTRPASPLFATWTHPIMLEFAVGVLMGAAPSVAWPRFAPATLAIAAVAVLAFNGIHDGPWRCVYYGLPAAALVAGAAAATAGVPGWLLLLGDSSYALYLVHLFPARGVRMVLAQTGAFGPSAAAVCLVAGVVLSCAVAVAVHLWVERPATRAARRLVGA